MNEPTVNIIVCPLSQVQRMITVYAPERIVSLLDPELTFPETDPAYVGRYLRLGFHDAHSPSLDIMPPTAAHVDELLAFLQGWSRQGPILIHCRAGIGRSTAAAFITACLHNPQTDELSIAKTLRQASPWARPNRVLVQLADTALGRNGSMYQAIVETGRNLPWLEVNENVPFELPASFPPT